MRKILALTMLLLFALSFNAFAFTVLSSAGTDGKLGLNTGGMAAGAKATVGEVGLSPKVQAVYNCDGTDNVSAQWYSIGTVHPGGNMGYGTAQNVNNIFSKSYATGDAVSAILGLVPVTEASESLWTDNAWSI